jgi:outer membrane lipoprotein
MLYLGCASYPISRRLRHQAIRADFAEVQAAPDAFLDETVIWGGRIIQTINDSVGTTLKVLQIPLNRYLEPTSARYTKGRFLARTSRFLDPEVYEKGLVITVAGTVVGAETQTLGETSYRYPVISIRELEVWTTEYYGGGYYQPRPYWWDPYYGPYYRSPYPYPYYRYPMMPDTDERD